MSSYLRNTLHPETGKFEPAAWIDDMFGNHNYGIVFSGGKRFDARDYEFPTNSDPVEAVWGDFFPETKDEVNDLANISPEAITEPVESANPPPDTLQDKIAAILHYFYLNSADLTGTTYDDVEKEAVTEIIKCIEDEGYVKR